MKYLKKFLSLDYRLLLALMILAGMMMQLIVIFVLMEPDSLQWRDPIHFHEIAQNLANNKPYSPPNDSSNLFRSPGYPFFLSLIIRLFGDSIFFIRIIHILLFPLFIISVFRIGKMFKDTSLGLIFSLLCTIYPYYIYIPVTLYSESLTIYLFPVFMLLTLRLRDSLKIHHAFLLALVSGFLIMCRPISIYLIIISTIYVFWHKKLEIKRFTLMSISIIIPAVFVLSWMVRNHRLYGEYVFSTGGPYVLISSYNENAIPGKKIWPKIPEKVNNDPAIDDGHFGLQKVYRKYAINFIKENPKKAFHIASMLIVNYWNPIPLTYGEEGARMQKYKIIPAFFYSVFLILGIIGYFYNRKKLFANTLLLLLILNTAFNAPLMVSVRYRVVVDFAFILFAAYVIQRITERILQSEKNAVAG
ncbi:MAG: glycosyltransferase family 39 protein [Bacteroidales bacterium]|nr:glycosyltransferase family 39 protein [Bacteroidales bacterium]